MNDMTDLQKAAANRVDTHHYLNKDFQPPVRPKVMLKGMAPLASLTTSTHSDQCEPVSVLGSGGREVDSCHLQSLRLLREFSTKWLNVSCAAAFSRCSNIVFKTDS